MQRTSEGELTMNNQYYCDRPRHKFMKSKTELKVAQVNILSINKGENKTSLIRFIYD